MLGLVLNHTWRVLCLCSGGGKVDPPDPLWAVHRVSGASAGAADQRQHGQSRRGGAARFHTGAHQTAGLLLQVQQTLMENMMFWPQINQKELWNNLRFLTFVQSKCQQSKPLWSPGFDHPCAGSLSQQNRPRWHSWGLICLVFDIACWYLTVFYFSLCPDSIFCIFRSWRTVQFLMYSTHQSPLLLNGKQVIKMSWLS